MGSRELAAASVVRPFQHPSSRHGRFDSDRDIQWKPQIVTDLRVTALCHPSRRPRR